MTPSRFFGVSKFTAQGFVVGVVDATNGRFRRAAGDDVRSPSRAGRRAQRAARRLAKQYR